MKRNNLNEVKDLDIKALFERAKALKIEISETIMDKNMDKHKDLKTVSKKRKDLAQVLTILRQKELVQELETKAEGKKATEVKPAEEKPVKNKVEKKPVKKAVTKKGAK